jgi:hypothetical protein
MGLPVPEAVPSELAPETLRNDRQVDARGIKHRLALSWRYPSYREGFAHCLGVAP